MSANAPARCDVVVIGAGISGLVAAGLLSQAGLSVCVVEEQPRPGGYLQGFSRQGYTFDTAIHWLNNLGPAGLVRRVLDRIGPGWPDCQALKRTWRFVGESYDYLLTDQPDDLRARFQADFPHESEGLARLFADAQRLGQRMDLLNARMRSIQSMGAWARARYGLQMLAWYWPLRRMLRADLETGLRRYFRGRDLERVFCAEDRLASVLVPIAWSYARDYFAGPPGGSQAWIAWLVEQLRAAGQPVLLGQAVERVRVQSGRANGVELAGGQVIEARWVVAACDVQRLYERMLPAGLVPAKLLAKLDRADLYYSCVMLYCGLACSQQELGLGEEMIRLTRDGLERAAHYAGDADSTALLVLSPTARDPSLAPAGKSSLTIQCPAFFEQHERWRTGPGFERGQAYQECKQAFADRLLARVERQLLPGLRDRLELVEIATPITFWRYSANRAGSIMGAKPTDENIRARIAHQRTPVEGLLLAGHWAEYGGGVPLAVKSAANASLLVLQRENAQAFRSLCALMDGLAAPPG